MSSRVSIITFVFEKDSKLGNSNAKISTEFSTSEIFP